jgi:hypothetical protein
LVETVYPLTVEESASQARSGRRSDSELLLVVEERADGTQDVPRHEAKAEMFGCDASTIRSANTAPDRSS